MHMLVSMHMVWGSLLLYTTTQPDIHNLFFLLTSQPETTLWLDNLMTICISQVVHNHVGLTVCYRVVKQKRVHSADHEMRTDFLSIYSELLDNVTITVVVGMNENTGTISTLSSSWGIIWYSGTSLIQTPVIRLLWLYGLQNTSR